MNSDFGCKSEMHNISIPQDMVHIARYTPISWGMDLMHLSNFRFESLFTTGS